MTRTRNAVRWGIAAVVAVGAIGGGAAVGALAASADPTLPPRSAAELLVDVQNARPEPMSGTVVQRSNLGLPGLPAIADLAGAGVASLLSGSNTLKVAYGGPEQVRVTLLGAKGQSDLIRNGQDVWLWQDQTDEATHIVLKEGQDAPAPSPLPTDPAAAADQVLKALDPSTEVTTDGSARIAGRDAYELVLRPRDEASLVDQVRLAVDAEKKIPLRVQLYGTAEQPAFEVAFTQLTFAPPAAEQFVFNPPPGTKVEEETLGEGPAAKAEPDAGPKPDAAKARPTVIGESWTSVLVAKLPAEAQAMLAESENGIVTAVLGELTPVSGAWGSGRLLAGTVFSALLTDDGRVLVGAVTPERLYAVAADPAAAPR